MMQLTIFYVLEVRYVSRLMPILDLIRAKTEAIHGRKLCIIPYSLLEILSVEIGSKGILPGQLIMV